MRSFEDGGGGGGVKGSDGGGRTGGAGGGDDEKSSGGGGDGGVQGLDEALDKQVKAQAQLLEFQTESNIKNAEHQAKKGSVEKIGQS